MAHFAELDENNKVLQVIVINNDVLDETQEEQSGLDFLASLFPDKTFIQTSYTGKIRGKYAAIGDTYDSAKNLFISPVNNFELANG